MNRFFLAALSVFAVIFSICAPLDASDERRSTPLTERTIEFEGQGGEFAELISDSGGGGFVLLLVILTALDFLLLVIAGWKCSKNQTRLAGMLAAVSKGKAGLSC